jgi:hypothetical protein
VQPLRMRIAVPRTYTHFVQTPAGARLVAVVCGGCMQKF